jgi:iron-sulfur cluster repair protein YtfE (RIC family)
MPNKMEEFGGKAAGQLKGAVGVVKGFTGIFKTLVQQHGEVSALLSRAKAADEPEKRLDLWSKIRIELLSHERAEMRVLYPELKQHEATRQIAEEHDDEASELEESIQELDSIDAASDDWTQKLEGLIDLVKNHVDDEENEWFPEAKDVIGKELADELNDRFLAQKEAVVEELG